MLRGITMPRYGLLSICAALAFTELWDQGQILLGLVVWFGAVLIEAVVQKEPKVG
jgi:hypothetical protein